MKTRGAAIQGGLAVLGLALAYGTWQREPEHAPGEATVIDVSKGDIQKVRFEDNGAHKWVEIDQKPAQAGEESNEAWIRTAPKPTPAPATPERYVRGNTGAEKFFEKVGPLRATRALGVLEAAKLKEFGLDAPKKKLVITAKGNTYSFDVGTSPYGVSDPYVKDQKDGRVYVLGGGVMSDLESASVRFVDRTFHTFKPADWDALAISGNGKKREFTQQSGDKPTDTKLVSKKTQKPDAEAKNWHDKTFRLVVTEVLGQGEKPAAGEPTPLLKLEYFSAGKQKGWLEIGRTPPSAPPANTSMPPSQGDLWGRSERSAGWMKLASNAEEIVKEGEKVLAGE
jgi:hypothetical protein